MNDAQNAIRLSLPVDKEYALVARMALSAMGVLACLDVDLIGDLRTVAGECLDCLAHQPSRATRVELSSWLDSGRLYCRFDAEDREPSADADLLDLTITRGVLETLMPDVVMQSDSGGVYRIECSMPV